MDSHLVAVCLFVFVLSVIAVEKDSRICADGWRRYNDERCYKIITEQLSWDEASAYCKAEQSDGSSSLIEITNVESNNQLAATVNQTGMEYWINIRSYIAVTYHMYSQQTSVLRWNRTGSSVQESYTNFENPMLAYTYTVKDPACGYIDDRAKWHTTQTCRSRKRFLCSKDLECKMGYYGYYCNSRCHCFQSACKSSGLCQYGCEVGWMGPRCDQIKEPAKVALYCINSPDEGKYALIRIDRRNVEYDSMAIVDDDDVSNTSTTCSQNKFKKEADGLMTLKININKDNTTYPNCPYDMLYRDNYKWTIKTEEMKGFLGLYDRLFDLSCDFKTAETLTRKSSQVMKGNYNMTKVKVIRNKENVQLNIENPVTQAAISQVELGSMVQLSMVLKEGEHMSAVGISPHSCTCSSYDGKIVRQLTDEDGCPVSRSPVSAFKGNGSYLTTTRFSAFTITNQKVVIFSCSFELCFDSNNELCSDRCNHQTNSTSTVDRRKRSTGDKPDRKTSAYLRLISSEEYFKTLGKEGDQQVDQHSASYTVIIPLLVLAVLACLSLTIFIARSVKSRVAVRSQVVLNRQSLQTAEINIPLQP